MNLHHQGIISTLGKSKLPNVSQYIVLYNTFNYVQAYAQISIYRDITMIFILCYKKG